MPAPSCCRRNGHDDQHEPVQDLHVLSSAHAQRHRHARHEHDTGRDEDMPHVARRRQQRLAALNQQRAAAVRKPLRCASERLPCNGSSLQKSTTTMPTALLRVNQVAVAASIPYVQRISSSNPYQTAISATESAWAYVNPAALRKISNTAIPNTESAAESRMTNTIFPHGKLRRSRRDRGRLFTKPLEKSSAKNWATTTETRMTIVHIHRPD